MGQFRIWHWMALVAAAGVLFAALRLDEDCGGLPLLLVLAVYICAILGLCGARKTGRGAWYGLMLGLLLGPVGAIFAWSNRVPEGWPESSRPNRC